SVSKTLAPSAANSRAIASPIPWAAPVTSANFPSNLFMFLHLSSIWYREVATILRARQSALPQVTAREQYLLSAPDRYRDICAVRASQSDCDGARLDHRQGVAVESSQRLMQGNDRCSSRR